MSKKALFHEFILLDGKIIVIGIQTIVTVQPDGDGVVLCLADGTTFKVKEDYKELIYYLTNL